MAYMLKCFWLKKNGINNQVGGKMSSLNSIISRYSYRACLSLFSEIKNMTYAHIKGEALSFQEYGMLGQRISSDIDIICPKKDLKTLEIQLSNHGFMKTCTSRDIEIAHLISSHQSIPWRKTIGTLGYVTLDLNFDIFWGEYEGKRIEIGEFLSDTIEMDLYGVIMKTLPPIKALIQLILHNYKDMNSIFLLATRKSIRYDMFKDVYYLIKNNLDTISIDKLYFMSEAYEIIPYVFYILYYTRSVFNDKMLTKYIEAFRTPEGELLLNCYGLCEKERKEWKYDFKTRLESENLYDLIKDDLTERDQEKIAVNKRIFLGR